MKKKDTIEWKLYRVPLWVRIKRAPFFFYYQYKHWREDGCGRLLALHHAYWFTEFYLI